MARYRKVEVAMWNDERFLALSPPPPNGQSLWIYLLTGPRTTVFPGLVIAREEVLASDLGWPLKGFREGCAELLRESLIEVDWKAGVIVLRKALMDGAGEPRQTSRPQSPNVLRGWAPAWDEIPECELKRSYLHQLAEFAERLGAPYAKAFRKAFHRALVKAGKPSAKVEPEYSDQDQDQEQEQERAGARSPETTYPQPAEPPKIAIPPKPAISTPPPRDPRAFGRLAIELWRGVSADRLAVAAELGLAHVLPLPECDSPREPGAYRELRDRLREEGAQAEAVARHVRAALLERARADRSIEWLAEKAFTEGGWRTARSYVLGAAKRPKPGASATEMRVVRRDDEPPPFMPAAGGSKP